MVEVRSVDVFHTLTLFLSVTECSKKIACILKEFTVMDIVIHVHVGGGSRLMFDMQSQGAFLRGKKPDAIARKTRP